MNAKTTQPPATVILGCSKCGAPLPDDAQFCLKCGKPVSIPAKDPEIVEVLPPANLPRRRKKTGRTFLWLALAAIVAAVLWLATSDSSTAQDIQTMVGWKHDEIILDEQFTVAAHAFRYYKFSLPEGSLNVAAVGEFSSTAENSAAPKTKDKGKIADQAPDNDIQVYILSEPAFTIWQNGYATAAVFDSGKVAQGKVQADVPAGAGIYYLVFNNKASAKTSKSIHASVYLRYKSVLPEWFRRMKERFLNWSGLD